MHVSVALLEAVSRSLAQHGVAPERLTDVGLADALPAAGTMAWSDAATRIERGLALAADPAIALHIGDETSARALQVVGMAMLTARSLRDAIAVFAKFAPLVIGGARFELVEEGERARIVFEPPPASPAVTRAVVEFAFALCSRIARELLQRDKRTWFVHVRHEDPGYSSEYARIFGCDAAFGCAENCMGFATSSLDLPLTAADDGLHLTLATRAEEALAVQENAAPLATRVRALLRKSDLDRIDARALAHGLGLTPTSLRRRLSSEGTPWSQLVDDMRRERALEALARPDTTIKELSDALGFSEPRAFHRAFRRWMGVTPNEYRERKKRGSSAV